MRLCEHNWRLCPVPRSLSTMPDILQLRRKRRTFLHRLSSRLAAPAVWKTNVPMYWRSTGILQGQLYLQWTYSNRLHQHATIEQLARHYIEALQTLITHCQSPEAGGYTPSDFPLACL